MREEKNALMNSTTEPVGNGTDVIEWQPKLDRFVNVAHGGIAIDVTTAVRRCECAQTKTGQHKSV